ncbi:DinB family protein [Rhizobiaceae bacterium n13]|uniref:DinB family protein n=1 Tax=Ferirhizobium litorale TaxID=2927786 RepID=A0AAE3QA69_9HYPH|nr:DinB family protein [Fererhizobium litorale]MDI7861073.1 DinB family protein [Fererhizobium litorale]MDI7921220.1 DinB family protein [Fererhizobium litorale]
MIDHFRMFAAYNRWANTIIYQSVAELTEAEYRQDMGAFFGSIHRTLNHVLVADRIWMKRFTGAGDVPGRLDHVVFDELTVLTRARQTEDVRIIDWIATLDDDDLSGKLTYVPISNPVEVTQRLSPALAHFFNHQTHHRGQVHAMITTLGRPSPILDLVYFLRDQGKQWL